MRTYPRNSPQAAGRIVALTLLADGHLSRTELDALSRLDGERMLGLRPGEMQAVLHGLCEDMLASADQTWSSACRIDADTLAHLMAEVSDPDLRRRVLQLCLGVANADRQLSESESIVLMAAVEQWGADGADQTALAPEPA